MLFQIDRVLAMAGTSNQSQLNKMVLQNTIKHLNVIVGWPKVYLAHFYLLSFEINVHIIHKFLKISSQNLIKIESNKISNIIVCLMAPIAYF